MRIPPVYWDDLYAMGVPQDARAHGDAHGCTIDPPPAKLVRQLLTAMHRSPPPEGSRLDYLRHVRDALVALTDWTQAADSPLTNEQRAEWAAYRQALRDLPQTYGGDGGPIPWPKPPGP